MPIRLLALPLSAEDLTELGRAGFAIMDQAVRTPGLLIAQAPDEPQQNGHPADDSVAAVQALTSPLKP